MRDEPLFDWRRDGFSQRTKMEFSMGISELIQKQIGRYAPLPGTDLDRLLDECLMKEIDGIEREARAEATYPFQLLICGGEDVPGHAATLTVEEAERVLREREDAARAEGAREERERLKDLALEQGNRIAQDNTTGCATAADAAQACWVKAAWIASQSNKEG